MSTRPHNSYRKFTAPRFLKKFHNGGEPILQAFLARYLPGTTVATANPLRVDDVIEFVQSREEMTKEATQLLNDANDLGNIQGAFFLRNALNVAGINLAPAPLLIAEHLSLKVLTDWPEVFVSAYDRLGLAKTDNFYFYAGREVRAVQDPVAVAQAFETKLRALKRSDKVIVRSFIEGEMVNFIFYHGPSRRGHALTLDRRRNLRASQTAPPRASAQLRPAITPPSTSHTAPVTQAAWSDNRWSTVAATSSARPTRPIGRAEGRSEGVTH
jgi:hypothetical protein